MHESSAHEHPSCQLTPDDPKILIPSAEVGKNPPTKVPTETIIKRQNSTAIKPLALKLGL